jgi:Mg-chelatase subunit ChlD
LGPRRRQPRCGGRPRRRIRDYVGGLRKVGLDVVLVIDTTESMQFVIDEVKSKLSQLVAALQRMVPTTRVGIVVYRDKGDDYVVKWTDLSFRTAKLQEFLSHIDARGGGDWEEAVKDGLDAAVNDLKWRKQAKRIIVLVWPPPHAPTSNGHAAGRDFRPRAASSVPST